MKNAKPHYDKKDNKHKIKIGQHVPPNAVNLAYYKNKLCGNDDENNIILSEAPKDLLKHKYVEKEIYKYDLDSKNPAYFDSSYFYKDDEGYQGDIPLVNIVWHDHKHFFEEPVTKVVTYTGLKKMQIPTDKKTITVSKEHESGMCTLEGTLGIVSVEYTPEKTTSSTSNKIVDKKFKRYTKRSDEKNLLKSPSYNGFPDTIEWNEDGYKGTLKKVKESERYIPIVQSNGKIIFLKVESSEINPNGITYKNTHLNYLSSYSGSTTFHTYGWCRYWSGNASSYSAAGGGGYGETFPRIPRDAYCFPTLLKQQKYVPTNLGIQNFSPDIETAKKFYSGATQNWLWVSNIGSTSNLNRIISEVNGSNKSDYTCEKLASMQGCPTKDSSGSYTFRPVTIRAWGTFGIPIRSFQELYDYAFSSAGAIQITGEAKSNLGLRYPPGSDAIYISNNYFKDLIGFYKMTRTMKKAVYGKLVSTGYSAKYYAECDYEGEICKTEPDVEEKALSYSAKVTYSGTISGGYTTYDAIGKYAGIVYKVVNTNNIDDINNNYTMMYPDNSGLLYVDLNNKISSIVEGEIFTITDVFKDEKPLFYSYRLKNKIYDNLGPDELGYYKGNDIEIIPEGKKKMPNNYIYTVKLIPTGEKNLYYADIYTNFITNSGNHFKCRYTFFDEENNKITADYLEEIFVQPYMQRVDDYTVANINVEERTNQITMNKFTRIYDSRNYIEFEYCIEEYEQGELKHTSEPIRAKALNYKYALKAEKNKFKDRNYIVSPISNELYQTAKDIVGIRENTSEKTFYAKLTSNSINKNVKDIVNLYTSPDGNGVVSAEIFADTGFYNKETNKYDKALKLDCPIIIKDNYIICGIAVYVNDNREIKITSPRNNKLLENWYPKIQYGLISQEYTLKGIKRKYIYSLPEYNTQHYSDIYERPYIDIVNEKAKYIDKNVIKTKYNPLYVHLDKNKNYDNLTIKVIDSLGKETYFKATHWSYLEGLIYIDGTINETDDIRVSYTYLENYYTYRGSFQEGKFNKLDINTNIYHNYTNLDNYQDIQSLNLLNKNIYFFVKPVKIINDYSKSFYNTKTVTKIFKQNSPYFAYSKGYVEGQYSGTLYKAGKPYLLSGESNEVIKVEQIQTLTDTNKNAFPEYIDYDENGYTGTLNKLGECYSIDTNYKETENREFIKYMESSDKENFSETYEVSEDGFSGTINKYGSPEVISGEIQDTQTKTIDYDVKYYSFEEIPDTYNYEDEDNWYGTLTKYSETKETDGHYSVDKVIDSKDYTEYSDIYETKEEIPEYLYIEKTLPYTLKDGTTQDVLYYGDLTIYKIQEPGEQIITIDKDGAELKTQTIETWNASTNSFDKDTKEIKSYYDNNEVENIDNISFSVNGKDALDDDVPINCKVVYGGYTDYSMDFSDTELQDGEKYVISERVYEHVRIEGSKTLPDIKGYKAKYTGKINYITSVEGTDESSEIVVSTTVTYRGTVTKDKFDTRIYSQEYRGTLTKEGYDNRLWKQKYKGTVIKNNGDTRVWCQKYSGILKLQNAEQYETTIIFVIDTSSDTAKYRDNIHKNIKQTYTNLRTSGLSSIKMGITYFDATDTYKYSFGGNYTESIDNVLDAIDKILSNTYDSTDNISFEAIQYTLDHYEISTKSKNVILVSATGTSKLALLSTDANICNNNEISIHAIMDVNDYRTKYIGLLCNSTDGRMMDIKIDFSDLLTEAVGVVCCLNQITITNTNTAYHKIDNDVPLTESDLLIGSIFMRHYTSLDATELIDARTRGGGIIETLRDNIRRELEPESDYYLDIGYNDGKPYIENDVIIIKLDIRILKEYGGQFSKSEIRKSINKWIAEGTVPLIEYVFPDNTVYDINNKIKIDEEVNEIFTPKPNFSITVENI